MKFPMKFVAAIGVLAVLLVAIVILLPQLVPAATYKGQLEQAASRSLGRTVTVGDDLSFRIFPQAAFKVSNLTISSPEGFDGAPLASVESADIGVALWPLLTSRSVEIDRFVMTRPVLNLVKRADGATNWELTAADAGDTAQEAAEDGGAGAPVRNLKLGDVRLVDGEARYTDEVAGQAFAAKAMNMRARLANITEPLEISGDLDFQSAPTRINLILTSIEKLLDGESADLKFESVIDKASASADMAITAGPKPLSYDGTVTFDAPDLPALAALLNVTLQDAPGFDRFSANGKARGDGERISLTGATIVFDEIKAAGDLAIAFAGVRPKATGTLDVDTLDLRPYMPEPQTTTEGFPQWSEDKLDLSSLRNMDAEFNLNAEKIFVNNLSIGASTMKLVIDNGRMTAEIPQMALYNGGGSGRLVVNARSATPSFSGVFDLTSISAEPFGIDFLNTDRLLGLGGARFEFSASGATQKAIMSSMDGKGGFELNDGAIKGVNIVKLVQAASSLAQGGVPTPASLTSLVADFQKPGEQTDFTRFLSQFAIEDGLINAPTITMEGPFLTMSGSGTINLPAQTIDLRLTPRASTAAGGEGGRAVAIPVRIGGTFGAPKIGLDAESLVRGRAENLGRDLLNRALGGAAGSASDDGTAAEAEAGTEDGADAEADPVRDLATGALDRIFGSRKKAEPETEQTPEPASSDDNR